MDLRQLVADIADALVVVDRSRVPFKQFQPGIGPYGEPQLVKLIATELMRLDEYSGLVELKRTPDLWIRGKWFLEFKIARPFGDNGKLAEDWSVNLLHPYPGNTSALGDCLKLRDLPGSERRAEIVIGYEHEPALVSLDPLIQSFEVIAAHVLHLRLGAQIPENRSGLVHPVHQKVKVWGWEVYESEVSA